MMKKVCFLSKLWKWLSNIFNRNGIKEENENNQDGNNNKIHQDYKKNVSSGDAKDQMICSSKAENSPINSPGSVVAHDVDGSINTGIQYNSNNKSNDIKIRSHKSKK